MLSYVIIEHHMFASWASRWLSGLRSGQNLLLSRAIPGAFVIRSTAQVQVFLVR